MSNKTPAANAPDATKSVRRRLTKKQQAGLVALLGLTLLGLWGLRRSPSSGSSVNYRICTQEQAGCTVRLETVASEPARQQGLSGRPAMPLDEGMLFVFDHDKTQCMWMKDMHFSLDMVWLSEAKQITHIQQAVAPQTYPKSFCGIGRYVIELNSGGAEAAGLRAGQRLIF